MNNLIYEQKYLKAGCNFIAGVDEAGRGPLAGPVVAAAVIFPNGFYHNEINDSKQISAKKRAELYQIIIDNALTWNVSVIESQVIDDINIYQATKKAMIEAIEGLSIEPDIILIDAMRIETFANSESIIKGDQKSFTIAASSIIAKVTRDNLMKEYQKEYPKFNFSKHKGYSTKEHQKEIEQFGVTKIHRKTFEPVRSYLEKVANK